MYHARSRASVGCGGSLTSVSAARQHLGIPVRRSDRASFERSALEHGRVSSWSCCRVATQPCWRRFYFVVPLSIPGGIKVNPSPFSDDLPCPSTNSPGKPVFVRPKPGNIYFSLSLVVMHRGIIETSPAGLRRHTAAAPAQDSAVLQCCALEGSSITAPSRYPEMLTCCRDICQRPPAAN